MEPQLRVGPWIYIYWILDERAFYFFFVVLCIDYGISLPSPFLQTRLQIYSNMKTCLIQVLYDCDEFVALNKPSGMYLTTNDEERTQSLENILLDVGMSLSTLNMDGSRGFAHRLDRGTSGCLIVTKNNEAHAEWISRFFLRQVKKSYTCLVDTGRNTMLPQHEGIIDHPVGGRPAESAYSLMERYGRRAARLQVSTLQGRKHQVRVHCSRGLNAPIILDPRYGGEQIIGQLKSNTMKQCHSMGRFCLHADTLQVSSLGLSVTAEVPSWWDDIVDDIKNFPFDLQS